MEVLDLRDTLLVSDYELPLVIRDDKIKNLKFGALEVKIRKGLKLELPLKVAAPLLEEQIAEVDYDKLPKLPYYNKVRWREQRLTELQELPQDFYIKASLYISHLNKLSLRGDEKAALELRRTKAALVDIIRLRMKKIANYAVTYPQVNRDLLKKMTIEEKQLYTSLCSYLDKWYLNLVKSLEEGEKIWKYKK